MDKYNITSILDMNNGAFKRMINRDVSRVINNIMDPFADPSSKRKVTITIQFTPTEDCRVIKVAVESKSTLAGEDGKNTMLLLTGDENGEVQLVEISDQLPGQMSAFDAEPTGKALDLKAHGGVG